MYSKKIFPPRLVLRSAAVLLCVALVACNKDDVIEPDEPDTPESVDENFRPAVAQSSPYQSCVFEYTPAPGQFINETVTGGFTGAETTPEAACKYAMERLKEQKFVSLGSFGGYIVLGFDHSIVCTGGYDIAIMGNPLTESNEPGVVWVMKDENGNGQPDDTWYELRGSETGKPSTRQQFSITYKRPAEPKKPVDWVDCDGATGQVAYLKAYHKQDYYYPAWVKDDSYTLTGTLLAARNSKDEATGVWTNAAFDWGYADNIGSDALTADGQWAGFKIANAIDAEGRPVKLDYVDFVKVQQAVLAQSGWIGENSCEVLSVADCSLLSITNL